LLVSQGVPMILGGDEIGRTQDGNNNAYCQDNELSWYDWDNVDQELLTFTQRLIAVRREHPVFRRRRWFHGRPIRGTRDIAWIRPDGNEMTDDDWDAGFARSIGLYLNGNAIPDRDQRGQAVADDSFLVLLNAHDETIDWTLPIQWETPWLPVLDTSGRGDHPGELGPHVPVEARSIVLLTSPR
jgi:glycogen operon protein